MTLIIQIKFELLNFLSKGTVIINNVLKHFLNFIAVILNYVGLQTLLQEGLSEPEFYSDLVYEFKTIVDKTDFPVQFKNIVTCYKKNEYSIADYMQSCYPNYG